MLDAKVQVMRGSQFMQQVLYRNVLPEDYVSVKLAEGRMKSFRIPPEPNESIIYSSGEFSVLVRLMSRDCVFLVAILNASEQTVSEGNFVTLSEAEAWAFRELAKQTLLLPKETLRAEIRPLSPKESAAYLSAVYDDDEADPDASEED